MQADSLPAELQGKPKNTGVGGLSLLQGIFLTQESNWDLLRCRQILYQLSYQGSPIAAEKPLGSPASDGPASAVLGDNTPTYTKRGLSYMLLGPMPASTSGPPFMSDLSHAGCWGPSLPDQASSQEESLPSFVHTLLAPAFGLATILAARAEATRIMPLYII